MNVPIGSIPVICSCGYREGYDLYEAVTDVGRKTERYYAVCRNCGNVIPLKNKKSV